MSEKKQAEMDICDKHDTANISIRSRSFHYDWQEKDVLFSHKIQKGSKLNSSRRQEFNQFAEKKSNYT